MNFCNLTEKTAFTGGGFHETAIVTSANGRQTTIYQGISSKPDGTGNVDLPSAGIDTECFMIKKTIVYESQDGRTEIHEMWAYDLDTGTVKTDCIWGNRETYIYGYLA